MEPCKEDFLKFCRFLRSFQCEKVPSDLLVRACQPKPTWSSSGEVVEKLPLEAGVPEWLVNFYNANKPLFHDPGFETHIGYVELMLENGIPYFQVANIGEPEPQLHEQTSIIDERAMAQDRLAVFLHAFPSINIEIFGEEMIYRLMDIAKSSIMPLLSCLTDEDFEHWLLPKNPEEADIYLFPLFQFLYQIVAVLAIEQPLLPSSLPERLLSIGTYGKLINCILALQGTAVDFNGSTLSDPSRLEFNVLFSENKTDKRRNAAFGYTLSMMLSSESLRGKAGGPNERLTKALSAWQPLSLNSPSAMEFLAAMSFCSQSQLDLIRMPCFPTLDTRTLEGLLLSRRKQYYKAAETLKTAIVDIASHYGPSSMQFGIVTAELANCYNVLRREAQAEATVSEALGARLDSSLSTRRDGIYLRLALIDSFIGRARYSEAVPMLQSILENPGISATFRMMSALRLARSGRRMREDAQKAFKEDSPLWVGLTLLNHVPQNLTMEYVEELACGISEIPNMQLGGSEKARDLIDAASSMLRKDGKSSSLMNSPSWDCFSKVQQEYSRRVSKHTELARGKQEDEYEKDGDKNDMDIPVSTQPYPCFPLRADVDISDEQGPWSERLVLSFDGGGVRALSSLLILRRIMKRIRELEIGHPSGPAYSSRSYPWMGNGCGHPTGFVEPGQGSFLPCHYFDYMAGVSTGGLSGIMLGRLRMSVGEAIYKFMDFGNNVYGDRPWIQQGLKLFSSRTKYSAAQADVFFKRLRNEYQSMRTEEGQENSVDVHGESFEWNGPGTRTMIMSWLIGESPKREFIWRSYETSLRNIHANHKATIWQVARITSATPPYFDAIAIDGFSFLDGAAVINNPSRNALQEVWSQHIKAPAIFVSLGTGQVGSVLLKAPDASRYKSQPYLKGLLEHTIDTATETKDWLDFAKRIGLDQAYRLDAGARLSDIPFDHWGTDGKGRDTFQDIRDITDTYLDTADVKKIIDCIAKEAVRIRRARAQTERWEAFAINVDYSCVLCAGTKVNLVYSCRADLRAHLEQSHEDWEMSDQAIENFLNAARKYRGEASFGRGWL